MKTLTAAFMFLFNYLDTLPKLCKYHFYIGHCTKQMHPMAWEGKWLAD